MLISEVIDTDISVRKTIWSKRGDKITRRVVDKRSEFDIPQKTHLSITPKETKGDKDTSHG